MRRMMILAALAALTLGACGTTTAIRDPGGSGGGENAMTVDAHEYMFDVEGTVQTGVVSIEYENTGKEIHHAILGRLDEGKTLKDIQAEVTKPDSSGPPEWFHDDPFDANLLSPGAKQTMSFPLTDAGTYVLLCFMPAPDGTSHVEKGMAATFTVEGSSAAELPEADATVEMTEYKFSAPSLSKGEATLAFHNGGTEGHDVILTKFAEGKSFADVGAWFQGGAKDAPPAEFLGGTHTVEPGQSITFTVPLDAGTYSLVCTEQTADGKQHADLGMITEFTVA